MYKILMFFFLIISGGGNIFFIVKNIQETHLEQEVNKKQEEISSKIYYTQNLFSADFQLKDYSATRFSLEQEGKDIIKNAREFHSSPAILKGEKYDKYLCAGFLYELSQKFWDPSAPFIIGMMDPKTKTPADAWQLPYSYEYVGGNILTDFSGDFSLEEKDYWKNIDLKKFTDFFDTAFSEEALFGDIGFLYKNTDFLEDLKEYQNYNSHITKNLGVSDFRKKISNREGKTQHEIFSEAFSCDTGIYGVMKPLLEHYEIYLDEIRIVLYKDNFYILENDMSLGELAVFQDMSYLSLKDITLIHFFEGAKVEGLFEMSCKGDFFPINIMSINPRFIEKM